MKPLLLTLALLIPIPDSNATELLRYQILESRPHDGSLFTQGLIKTRQGFFESSGLYRRSKLVNYTLGSPPPNQRNLSRQLPRRYFAEGLTLFGNQLYLLTWKAGRCLVFDARTLEPTAVHRYRGEGWGLTHDGHLLIMSDGSETLSFRRPDDFSLVKTLAAHTENGPWRQLNELEFIRGEIWANTWRDSRIVTIDPNTGRITGILDLRELVERHSDSRSERVLNGIAYDADRDAVWVTGKYWPRLYLIRVLSPR